MSILAMPGFNVGRSVYTPNIAPAFNIPGFSMGGTAYPAGTGYNYAPLGDWQSRYGLTSSFGNKNVPVTQWYTNPSPLVKSLDQMVNNIKTLPPVIPTTGPLVNRLPNVTSPTANQFSWAAKPPPVTVKPVAPTAVAGVKK